jgi:UDP:flavonoid glycosyltransferase YjiC (YdhE family)
VASRVDQWDVLAGSDVFITHQGLNSTHEAIFHRIPMLSYPFFWDQPALAQRCRELGLAVPLADEPRAPLTEHHVRTALAEVASRRDSILAALTRAREWERQVMAGRDSVVERLVELAGKG